MALELMKANYGLDIVHVPYKAADQAMPGLIANQTQMMFTSLSVVGAQVKAGKVRALAMTTPATLDLVMVLPAFFSAPPG